MKGPRLLEAKIQVVLTALSRGADSLPKARQAARVAPAARTPMRFTCIDRCDVNEPGTIVPRRCDGRPRDQRLGPQVEAT
ncbi:MAG: hypothetical protein F4201_05690 [Nitrospira sp. SB0677_bin_15]|nr:hypothetical protein [Nitrospira sp. SB0667_bin_9]MYD30845.1 hypothetical protein [Nitrospira sp. SB0661_bin_20]MYG40290.1 hypothetical protein [Nitrospira sp. SB0677_bin_15]MYH01587.1 hypothetical protein [Nitrospira sp. SB0675_bin_23]